LQDFPFFLFFQQQLESYKIRVITGPTLFHPEFFISVREMDIVLSPQARDYFHCITQINRANNTIPNMILAKKGFLSRFPPLFIGKRKKRSNRQSLLGRGRKQRKKERKKIKVKLADTLVHVFAFHSQLEGRERESRHNN